MFVFEDFKRVKSLPPYVLARFNNAKKELVQKGYEVIDLGMGSPNLLPPQDSIDILVKSLENPENHRYSPSQGIPELRQSVSRFYHSRFGISLDYDKEIVVTIGAKEGIATFAEAIVIPGDKVVVSNPCYPIHRYAFSIAGANVIGIKTTDPEEYLQQFCTMVEESSRIGEQIPKIFVLNYPSNPTAATVNLEYYSRVVKFCKEYNIIVISDLAYSEIYYEEENKPPSILEISGAKDIAIEFTTMSKSFSMSGWRLGFAVGNSTLIQCLLHMKSYLDYGTFKSVQIAAAHALDNSDEYLEYVRDTYKKRNISLSNALQAIGWTEAIASKASMFLWIPIPARYKHMSSIDFCTKVLEETHVLLVPGIGFGTAGDGYVRIALVENEERLKEVASRLQSIFI